VVTEIVGIVAFDKKLRYLKVQLFEEDIVFKREGVIDPMASCAGSCIDPACIFGSIAERRGSSLMSRTVVRLRGSAIQFLQGRLGANTMARSQGHRLQDATRARPLERDIVHSGVVKRDMLIRSLIELRAAPQPLVLALGFVALMLISVASIGLGANRQFDADREEQSLAIKADLETLLSSFRRAESTERAYLLTADDGYRSRYLEASEEVMPLFERARQATLDNYGQRETMIRLGSVLHRKLEQLHESVTLYQAGDQQGALRPFRSGESHVLTMAIRASVAELERLEGDQFALRFAETRRTDMWLLAVDLVGVALVIGLAAISIAMVRRSTREREAAMRSLALANMSLETTVAERTEHLQAATEEAGRTADILNGTFTSLADAVIVVDRDGVVTLSNPAADRLLGPREAIGTKAWRESYELFLPDGVTPVPDDETPIRRTMRGETVDAMEVVLRRAQDPKPVAGVAGGRPILDGAGIQRGAVIVFRDVTVERETERLLRQSQKMDAIGQLTGGVAHDFNNILTVIMTTIEILADAVADRPQLAMIARMIDEAAGRGAALTQQLLAFARKQPLQPRKTDVNALILGAAKLLRPTLGEQMEIACELDEATLPALVDQSQLTTALLNLALNARDAMPNGGKLTIASGNVALDGSQGDMRNEVKPGTYVMMSVTDTGVGIPPAIRDKVFEPFFTTKGAGRGTGLGLSTVYGFVKQSGGHVKIVSDEGRGSTVTIYLPSMDGLAEDVAPGPPVVPSRGGREAILVVEDDGLVRANVVAQLESLGYSTLAAQNASEALSLLDRGKQIDLLFTDVVMPGAMNGRQLAEEVVKRRPATKVLYTSGYSEDAIVHHGRLDPDVLLLPKPYRKSDLDHMVRRALEGFVIESVSTSRASVA
jgi:signal transduction histidine kinase/CHASE3 domain sensor protein